MSIQLIAKFPNEINPFEDKKEVNLIYSLSKCKGMKILKAYNINLLLLYQQPINYWSTDQIIFIHEFLVKLKENQKEQMIQNDVLMEFNIDDIDYTKTYFETIIKHKGIIKVL